MKLLLLSFLFTGCIDITFTPRLPCRIVVVRDTSADTLAHIETSKDVCPK